ncbi:hypothetical protein CHA01nite_33830 [Chryseobacterium hagamense]|uniref:Uncharacterized protein n=2 Tax=Chryseobacterium hagamense TaxID=395935 RepID=A0A511YR16_9FLAO|nr:hypothetical protein CHA01nite_33830 [Chryseobacterium hagamense]
MQYSENNINVADPVIAQTVNESIISVKGLANVKAEEYVAIFSITQVAESAEEVNDLIDRRITSSLEHIKTRKGVETYVDMISFVPVYQEKRRVKRPTTKYPQDLS